MSRFSHAFTSQSIRGDLVAGLTLGAVMVPVGMAFGELAGLPIAGLYASILPLLAYAVFGSSRHLVVGPDASMSSVVAVTIAPLAAGDLVRFESLIGTFAVMIGLVCLLASVLRLGFMANFLAKPVIIGLMHGLAVVIFASQLSKLLGFDLAAGSTPGRIAEAASNLSRSNWIVVALGVSSIAVILSLRRWAPRVPGQLVALVGCLVFQAVLSGERFGIAIIGDIPAGLPRLSLPQWSWSDVAVLWPSALAGALVAFSDTVVTASAFASRNHYSIAANREMLALGASNIVSGFSHGLPVSGSGSRTALAESAGGRSRMTSVIAAVVVTCVMLFLTPFLRTLPTVALGALLVVAALGLVDVTELRRLWKFSKSGFCVALLTFGFVAAVGVMEGIAVGVLASLLLLVHFISFPGDAVLGRVGNTDEFHDVARHPEARALPGVLIYRLAAPLFFANSGIFRSRLEREINESPAPIKAVIVDASGFFAIDLAGCDTLIELHRSLNERGIELMVANAAGPIRDTFVRGGVTEFFGEERIFSALPAAVNCAVKIAGATKEQAEAARNSS
jgi:high affinity sulfate transporter 1